MSNLLYLALFLGFLAIVIAIRVTRDRRMVIALFAYIVAIHVVLAVTKRDAWPFVTHGAFLESGNEYRPLSVPRFAGVDASGQEHAIDPHVWAPVSDRTLSIWWLKDGRLMTDAEQDEALAFLLRKAQTAPNRFAIAPNWYSVEPTPPPAPRLAAIRVLLVTRVPAVKLKSGEETSQVMAQFPR